MHKRQEDSHNHQEEPRGDSEESASNNKNQELISEAITRILLDIIVRGHGLRLIGRWSREPGVQLFLERVPYLLDRINQLHLCCERGACKRQTSGTHNKQNNGERRLIAASDETSAALHDFVQLIANKHHWLVRTRDSLGLTPLHKAVLNQNRPIAEFILDRYPDELAPLSHAKNHGSPSPLPSSLSCGPTTTSSVRLIDAQDKFGRSPLHYAAVRSPIANHLYNFLLQKGASRKVVDFRGKTPDYYLEHPHELRARSIVHLAQRKSASYQASVFSRTLVAGALLRSAPLDFGCAEHRVSSRTTSGHSNKQPAMSVSCFNLPNVEFDAHHLERAASIDESWSQQRRSNSLSELRRQDSVEQELLLEWPLARGKPLEDASRIQSERQGERRSESEQQDSLCSSPTVIVRADENRTAHGAHTTAQRHDQRCEAQLKRLVAERSERPVTDAHTRHTIVRTLHEGNIGPVQELLLEGHGHELLRLAPTACWNLECRRYIERVVAALLEQVDQLHECIASNKLVQFERLLSAEPSLSRLRRPYRRCALNALHLAVQMNRKRMVKHLVRRFPELVSERDSTGATCLHWAAKSLQSERIFCWLSEHFGAQLEQVRDARNKTAADFRQQAIRLASFEQQRRRQQQTSSPGTRNAELESVALKPVCGLRIGLKQRPAARPKPQLNTTKRRLPATIVANETRVQIGVTCATPPPPPTSDDDEAASSRSSPLDEREHAAEEARQQQQTEAQGRAALFEDELAQLDCADLSATPPELSADSALGNAVGRGQQVAPNGAHGIAPASCDFVCAPNALEAGQQQEATVAPITTSLVVEPAKQTNSLEATICECLRANDFKKLEHLILAGCGQRIQATLEANEALELGQRQQLSDEMRAYLGGQALDLMKTMELIHSLVHHCFACSDQSCSKPATTDSDSFLKLCNLMERRRSFVVARDQFGATPVQVATMRADKRLLDYLLRRHPDAPSAPDQEGRSALHYAALALAFYESHASNLEAGGLQIRLTTRAQAERAGWQQQQQQPVAATAAAYWPLNENVRQIFDNLCARYGTELLDLRDRRAKSCQDYLAASLEPHTLLSAGLHEPHKALRACCADYASLLERYNYLVWIVANCSPSQEALPRPLSGQSQASEQAQQELVTRGLELQAAPVANGASAQKGAPSPRRRRTTPTTTTTTLAAPLESCLGAPISERPSSSRSSNGRDKQAHAHFRRRSIVGGVIVPTIIHNDKMDEIETYDIIYRQPAGGGSSRHSSGSSSSWSGAGPTELGCAGSRLNRTRRLASEWSSADEDDERDDHDDHDDRVERLSDEFERRVLREKNELSAKVDQIMREIKLSAKSGKSARLLASPNDLLALDEQSGAVGTTLLINGQQQAAAKQSSLGDSATSCSTRATTNSTSNSAGASSCSTSCSKSSDSRTCSSCSARSLGGGGGARKQLAEVRQPTDRAHASTAANKNTYGQTYLHFIASRAQTSQTLYKALRHATNLIGERDLFYRTARDVAIQFNLPNNVQTLDKFIIDLFINSRTETLWFLLQQGYSPLIHVADPDGNDIMLILKLLKLEPMIKYLLHMADFQRWRDELHTFIRHGYLAGVSELICKHCDLVRAKSIYSRTSLHLAVLFDRLDMVNELLERDPSCVQATDNMARTPLHYTYGLSLKNGDAMRNRLLAAGANLEARDVNMRMPKYYYIFRREIEEIRRIELELD